VDNENKASYARAYAEQFDEERRRSGKTYDELADVTQISKSSLIRYAKGTREIGTVDEAVDLHAHGVEEKQ
jgi:transcriptional regulator with XRE-family HTH domain